MIKKGITKSLAYPKSIQDSYIANMEGIEIFVENVEPVVAKYDETAWTAIENAKKEISEIIAEGFQKRQHDETNLEEKRVQRKEAVIEKAADNIIKVLVAHNKLPKVNVGQVELLYRSAFVLLTAFLDYLIHDVIHCYYKMYPDSLSDKDRELSVSLNDLKTCSDLDEAVDLIVEKKVDSILYGSLTSQKKFLKEYLHIDVSENFINWDIINEAVERRNVIVHNDCTVNRRYLRNVELAVVPEGKKLKEGARIGVGKDYFKRAFEEMLVAGVVIVQSCWRKWLKDDLSEADTSLIWIVYNLLRREDWHLVEKVGYVSKGMEVEDAASRNILDINYCQSLKWQGKKVELNKELDKFDESSLSPKFKVGLAALRGDSKKFYKYAEQAVAISEIGEEAFSEWPLFRELRQDAEYEGKIKAILDNQLKQSGK